MVERLLCMQEVLGSIPRFSSDFFYPILYDTIGNDMAVRVITDHFTNNHSQMYCSDIHVHGKN